MNRSRHQRRSEARSQFRRPATVPPRSIKIHIEELVLHGFAPNDRYRIGDAVDRELARLLAEGGIQGLPIDSAAIERLDGGAFTVAPGSVGQSMGLQIAQTLYHGLASSNKSSASRTEHHSETGMYRR